MSSSSLAFTDEETEALRGEMRSHNQYQTSGMWPTSRAIKLPLMIFPRTKTSFSVFFLSEIKEYGVYVLCFSLRCSSHLKEGGVLVCLFHCWYVSKLSSSPALLQGCLRPPRLPVLLCGALFQLFQKFSRLPTFNPSSLSLWVEFHPSQKIYSNLVSVTLFGNRILAGDQVKTRSCMGV